MTDIKFLAEPDVHLIDSMGGDFSIVRAARVSVVGENFVPDDDLASKDTGLINYLIREKHGSPFEHNAMTFFVKAPIFVFREFHRHRVGFSYNEMSGRYTKLAPEFYLPAEERPLVNVGSSSKPEFAPGDETQIKAVDNLLQQSYQEAWTNYEHLLELGIGNEVARTVLPVGIASQMYVTCNARSMMNFLALRTKDERAVHLSRPQYEIEQVARKMEAKFADLFPVTYDKFNEHGRVAP